MSPRLEVDFNEVPDVIKPITPAEYELEIAEVPKIEPTSKGTGQNMIVKFRITTEGEFFGRQITDYIFLSDMGMTKVKNLVVGCGLSFSSGGFDTEEMLGAKVNALLVANVYKDPVSGETISGTKVSKYRYDKEASDVN